MRSDKIGFIIILISIAIFKIITISQVIMFFIFSILMAMRLTYKDWWLEYIQEWDVLIILSLYVEDRRKWTATKLMQMLREKAEELEVDTIEFSAMSFDEEDGMPTEDLKDWYERLGFESVVDYSIWTAKWYVMKMEL